MQENYINVFEGTINPKVLHKSERVSLHLN